MHQFEGQLFPNKQLKIGIVVARFNELVTKALLEGAKEHLRRCGIHDENIDVAWVPGAFEIPVITQRMAKTGGYDAIITLGAVIRGATAHFDYVAGPVASQIATLSTTFELPIIFGVLTTDTLEQALERAGSKAGNKGAEAAAAAIEMSDLLTQLSGRQETLLSS